MENWLLNWSGWITRNTHAEMNGLKYENGPQWFDMMFDSWKKNSMYGKEYEEYKRAFVLTETQQAKLDEWKNHIKAVFGEYGNYEYIFKPNGIGVTVSVFSELADRELDLTEVENW